MIFGGLTATQHTIVIEKGKPVWKPTVFFLYIMIEKVCIKTITGVRKNATILFISLIDANSKRLFMVCFLFYSFNIATFLRYCETPTEIPNVI